jgi:rifampicin phosphotransferase
MKFVYGFDYEGTPELTQVGGKGMSLILMTQQGLPVPYGFVLSVEFFKPWFNQIINTPEWKKVIDSPMDELKVHSDSLKKICRDLKLDEERKKALIQAISSFEGRSKILLFAVRSSSPEEDIEGASFAGGYETTLGVRKDTLEDALRCSFVSCLDECVFVYKKEHGFGVDNPSIAVIVQIQVPSVTSGVAFSLNPINNCYDEAVINANFGLGESVVSGAASPDSFIIDKVSRRILDKKVGRKETSVWLASDGGTYVKPSPSKEYLCIKDEEVMSLVSMIINVENYYKNPVDIEWAFADGILYLLQARPITAYIPLHEKMQTAPGQQKLLYLDETLAKQGIHEPLSVMGTDYLAKLGAKTGKVLYGKETSGVMDGMGGFFQGRMYLNISNQIKLYGKKKLQNTYSSIDMVSAQIIGSIDEDEYVPKALPTKLKGVIWGLVRSNLGTGLMVLKALKDPKGCEKKFQESVRQYIEGLQKDWDKSLTVKELAESINERFASFLIGSLPIIAAAMIAKAGIKKIFKEDKQEILEKVEFLDKALQSNITTMMGFNMYDLSRFNEIAVSILKDGQMVELDGQNGIIRLL